MDTVTHITMNHNENSLPSDHVYPHLQEVIKVLYLQKNLLLFLDEVIRLAPLELSTDVFDEIESIRQQLEKIKHGYLDQFEPYQLEQWFATIQLDNEQLLILKRTAQLIQKSGLPVKVLSLIHAGFPLKKLL